MHLFGAPEPGYNGTTAPRRPYISRQSLFHVNHCHNINLYDIYMRVRVCYVFIHSFIYLYFIVQFDFVPGVLFLSWVLVPWFSVFANCGYNSYLLPSPGLGQKRGLRNMPHHSASKLKPLKAFNMHLNTLFKVQASMFCKGQSLGGSRKFRHKWRPDWSLICNYER